MVASSSAMNKKGLIVYLSNALHPIDKHTQRSMLGKFLPSVLFCMPRKTDIFGQRLGC